MKDKILVWISPDILHYFIGYGIQKNYDADYFVIYDLPNKIRKFFLEQKLLKFKKQWFFSDNVKKNHKSPDYNYLHSFEQKYNINLWKLAINERVFYRFFKFHKFSTEEIASIIEQECKFFEKVLDEIKPDFIVTKEASRHHHELFSELCISRGIEVLTLSKTFFGSKTMISKISHILDSKIEWERIQLKNRTLKELQEYIQSFNFLKAVKKSINKKTSNVIKLKAVFDYLISDSSKNRDQYYYYGRTKFKVLSFMFSAILKKRFRKSFIDKNLERDLNYNVPYIYFPIHVDMERPLLISTPFFTNQIEIIRHVAKALPMGYRLYVKETPAASTREWRSISTYKEIMDIPNVTLIHPEVSVEKLMEKCSVVLSIAGTSGFEAAFYEKPSVVFSDTGYIELPSVTRVKEIEKLPQIIREAIKTKIDHTYLDKFISNLEENIIDFNWFEMEDKIANAFFYDGSVQNAEINARQMELFLEDNTPIFDYVGNEYIKKIQWLKNNKNNHE